MQKEISLIIPVYEEELTIKEMFSKLLPLVPDCEVIAVEDGSKDKSYELLKQVEGITVLRNEVNKGYGYSLKKGIKAANGKWIIIIDCDGTYPLEDIRKLIDEKDKYDMVVGSRTGENVNIEWIKRGPKQFLNLFASYIAGSKIPDLNSGLRIFKKEIAMKYMSYFPNRFSFTSTITMICLTNDYSVKYIPINYFKRKGKSSIKARDFFNFMQLVFKLAVYFRPLKVFGPISLLMIFSGLIKTIFDWITLDRVGGGTVMVCLTGIILFSIGLLSDLIIKRVN
jgi:glycosyltransferase involved in cell wall biosynthesis